jgi:Protein of unknown function (DUF3025)
VAHGLERIDWHAPWLAPWRGAGEPVARAVAGGMRLPDALNAAQLACPVRFVPQSDLPTGQAYERYIFESGTCPTREGLHDFFNGLCWHVLPESKRRMNQLQAAQIAQRSEQALSLGSSQAGRGAVRDALTLLDENGALLHAPEPLWQALTARDWPALFITHRALWQQAQLFILGHALLEKLVQPRKPLVAHVWWAPATMDSVAAMDRWLAHELTLDQLARKPFAPLPVLGVPGWWAANAAPQFYADTHVFRPPRNSLA